ncbi:uromodulin-like [Hypanus sabinus]|uniref:uromodulin-like n=1 Tax=Hypanus sabinus TaxID=79690 RepID=UPI0028C40FDB|nr:uromodulin-like [Hypanus sabinus]
MSADQKNSSTFAQCSVEPSSGGWKIPETVLPEDRCSGVIPGWINGSHPNVGEGEVTRTACFPWSDCSCYWSREIGVKNCSSFFVYHLKPTPCSSAVYCTDYALSDPCVTHTVLDQPWRSTNCFNTECTHGQWMGDGNLDVGWYRFDSSGGWKIPETVLPEDRCSGVIPGWINGSHPNVGEGEVTRTACFPWSDYTCYWSREIGVKNCSSFFVYHLKPTPCSSAVYCTAYVCLQRPSLNTREECNQLEYSPWYI